LQVGQPCFLIEFPSVGQPCGSIAVRGEGQIGEQLRQVDLRIDVMPPAGGGQAGQDGRFSAATRIADEEAVFPIQNHTFHFALGDIMPSPGLCRSVGAACGPA